MRDGITGKAQQKNYMDRLTKSANNLGAPPALPADQLGASIYLKREDLLHTGAHKINNAIYQIVMAKRMGKTRIIAETGAGQHGVATATVCALFGLPCVVYMGQTDIERQAPNVFRMKLLGAEVVPVTSGSATLKDAMNEALRDDYVKDCQRVLTRWNRTLEKEDLSFRLSLPSTRFFRRQGIYADHQFDLQGNLISQDEYDAKVTDWLPTDDDREYVASLMTPVTEPGKVANWIGTPRRGINRQPVDFEYVRL